jgi:hypothetical protein
MTSDFDDCPECGKYVRFYPGPKLWERRPEKSPAHLLSCPYFVGPVPPSPPSHSSQNHPVPDWARHPIDHPYGEQ